MEMVFTTSTAEMTLLMELRDSLSGEILARIAERREALPAGAGGVDSLYHSNAVTDIDAVKRLYLRWAKTLAGRLEQIHTIPPTKELGS